MSDNSGIVNLRSLGRKDNIPKWTVTGGDGWQYSYNPCYGWSTGSLTNLAVILRKISNTVLILKSFPMPCATAIQLLRFWNG